MSKQEFENYLKLIGKLLQLSRSQQKQISGELRDHLQSRVADLVADGWVHEEAVGLALEEFGDAAAMARNFQAVTKLKRRRWMMRFATLSMACAFFLAVFSMAMWPSTARFGSPEIATAQDKAASATNDVKSGPSTMGPSSSTQRDLEAEAVLRKPVSLNYLEVEFSEILRDLRDMTDLNLILDQSARDDSLTEDEPITFRIDDVPLEKALTLMLKEKNATFYIDGGVVVFISLDDAPDPQYMRVRMYNCKDLIEKLASSSGPTPAERRHHAKRAPGDMGMGGGMGGGFGGGGGGTGGLGGGDYEDEEDGSGGMAGMGGPGGGMGRRASQDRPKVDSKQDLLLDLIYMMVEPEYWEEVSEHGTASAKIINGVLIVKHQQSAFGKIESLLKDLSYQVNSKDGFGIANPVISKRRLPKANRPAEDPFNSGDGTRNPFRNEGADSTDDRDSDKDPFGADDGDPFGR